MRKVYDRFASGLNRTEVSVMGMTATQAGYEHGGEWLENVLEVIQDNYRYLKEELGKHLPEVTVCALEGSYLVLLGLRKLIGTGSAQEFVQKKCRLAVDYGEWFGESFAGFIRLNLATDPAFVRTAVENLINGSYS